MDKLSYAWGLAMGQQLKGMGVKTLNVEDFNGAVKSVFEGTEPEMTGDEARKIINEYLQELQTTLEAQAKEGQVPGGKQEEGRGERDSQRLAVCRGERGHRRLSYSRR